MIAIYLIIQQVLDADLRAIKQINFTESLENSKAISYINEQVRENSVHFLQGNVRVLLAHNRKLDFALIKYHNKITQYASLNVKVIRFPA